MDQAISCVEMEEPQALKIQDVLEHILGYLCRRDLKQCRLVSTLWRDSAAKAFKFFPLKLTSSTKTREFVRVLNDPRPPAGSRPQLYASFILTNTSLNLSRQSAAFWTISGSHIKRLELSNIKLKNGNELRNIILNHCSNLKELILRKVSFGVLPINSVVEPKEWQAPQFGESKTVKRLTIDQAPGSLGISWMELITYFPALKILRVENSANPHQSLFEAILLTRQHDASKLVLTEIHFSFDDNLTLDMLHGDFPNLLASKVADLLSKTNLQLRALSIDLSGGGIAARSNSFILGRILESQGSCLQKLVIQRSSIEDLDPIILLHSSNIPLLENLQELNLHDPVFKSMWIVKMMPNLRKLSFCQPDFSADENYQMETELDGVQLIKCVHLKVKIVEGVSMQKLELLVNLFPNVERLCISEANNIMFQLICERWPNLVDIHISQSEVNDYGITGLDEEDVERINELGGKSKWRPITVPRANIAGLKHLRSFSMFGNRYPWDHPFLGYCGKLYGFEETPNLEDLLIIEYDVDEQLYKQLHLGNRKIKQCIISKS